MNPKSTTLQPGESRIQRALVAVAAVVLLAGCSSAVPSGRATRPATAPDVTPSSVAVSVTPTAVPGAVASSTGSVSTTVVARRLHDVHVVDATFVAPDDGWLLASADCAGGSGTCTAMLRTTDGGAHWTGTIPPPVDVPGVDNCTRPCAMHLRFATTRIGYAFGPGVLLMTTDGGAHWTRQPGGAEALETLDGNVIRLRPVITGCTLGCTYSVETSAIGSTRWRRREQITAYQLALARGGHDAYVLTLPHTSGNAASVLYRSTDDGRAWQITRRPCRSVGGVRALAVAAGSAGRLAVLCTVPGKSAGFVAVSADSGVHLWRRDGTLPDVLAPGTELAGDPDTVLVVSRMRGGRPVGRSTDGGENWAPVAGVSGGVGWLGFESATTGHIVSGDGGTIWTTHDAGAQWTRLTL